MQMNSMSEINMLSRYWSAAEFSRVFNEVLIQIKKYSLGLVEETPSSRQKYLNSRSELASILTDLIRLFTPQEEPSLDKRNRVVAAFLEHLLVKREPREYLVTLQELTQRLQDPESSLTKDDFRHLDDIAEAADAQASKVFQRLMHE